MGNEGNNTCPPWYESTILEIIVEDEGRETHGSPIIAVSSRSYSTVTE